MHTFRNVMEHVVEEKLDELFKTYDGCKCDRCRADIMALTLNNLPPRYAVTDAGELFTKIQYTQKRYELEVIKQLASAANLVKEFPHHD